MKSGEDMHGRGEMNPLFGVRKLVWSLEKLVWKFLKDINNRNTMRSSYAAPINMSVGILDNMHTRYQCSLVC